jgi:hypothetical protein
MHKDIGLKVVLFIAVICFWSGAASAHKPLLAVEDNEDGTIYCEAGFSDGSSAAGHKIALKEEKTGKVISEHKVAEDGTLELKKPDVPYTVTLDAGEGHTVTQTGPPPSAAPAEEKSTDEAAPKGDVKAEKAPAQTGKPSSETTSSKAKEPAKPAQAPTAAVQPQPQPAPVTQVMPASAMTPVSAGAMMAFKMTITTQIVTATALIVLLVVVVYFIGYTAGKNAAGTTRRREV